MKKKQYTKQDVFDYFDGIPSLADQLGIEPQAIYQWGEQIPEARAFQIQVLSKNHFTTKNIPVKKRDKAA